MGGGKGKGKLTDITTHMRKCIATYQQQGEGEDLPSVLKDAVNLMYLQVQTFNLQTYLP